MSVPPHRRSLAEHALDRDVRDSESAPGLAVSSQLRPSCAPVSRRTSVWQRPLGRRRLSIATVSAADSKTIASTDSRPSSRFAHPPPAAPPPPLFPPPRTTPIVSPSSHARPDSHRSQHSDEAAHRAKPPPPPPLLSSFFAPVLPPPPTRHEPPPPTRHEPPPPTRHEPPPPTRHEPPGRSQPWPHASPAGEPLDPPPTPSPSRSRTSPPPAPAVEPGRDDGRRVCDGERMVSIVTYNILSTELDGDAHHVGSRREHLAFEYRLRGVRRKLGEFVAQAAVVCVQEMTRKWREALVPFFAEHGYSLMSQTYGGGGGGGGGGRDGSSSGGESKHSDGVAIALPPHLAVASWSVIRVADVIRRLAHLHLSRRPTAPGSRTHLEASLHNAVSSSETENDERFDDERKESETTVDQDAAADKRKAERKEALAVERKERIATSSEIETGDSSGSSSSQPVIFVQAAESFDDSDATPRQPSTANISAYEPPSDGPAASSPADHSSPSYSTDSAAAAAAAAECSPCSTHSGRRHHHRHHHHHWHDSHYSHQSLGRHDRPPSFSDADVGVAPRLRAAIGRATSRDNLLLVMRVRDRRTAHGGEFVVGTYHSPCAYADPEVLAMHVGVASHVVQTYAPALPCVLAGDLNVRPCDPAYAMLRSGFALAGLGECGGGDGALRIGGLRSAYAASRRGCEPAHTVHSLVAHSSAPFTDTLDYIFFSRHWRGVTAVAELPTAPTAASHPSEHEPSDHLALCATLVL